MANESEDHWIRHGASLAPISTEIEMDSETEPPPQVVVPLLIRGNEACVREVFATAQTELERICSSPDLTRAADDAREVALAKVRERLFEAQAWALEAAKC